MKDLSFSQSEPEKFLCKAIRSLENIDKQELVRNYNEVGDMAVFQAAEKNGVVPNVASALLTSDLASVPAHWINAYNSTEEKICAYLCELDNVADEFAKANIQVVALKNSGITRGIYKVPGASPMGDIDVLVRENDFFAAHEILLQMGFILKFRNPNEKNEIHEAFKSGGAEYLKTLPSGHQLWFELQWRPIAGRWIQPGQEPQAEELMGRSKKITGSNVRILAPEDNLLQVCLHTAKHSYVRAPGFRLHTDVDRIVSGEEINWGIFVEQVRLLNVKTATYFSLAMAKCLLGTKIPNDTLEALDPPILNKWFIRSTLDRVGIFDPDERKWSNIGYIIFVAMLYDRPKDLWRSIFPSMEIMRKKYNHAPVWLMPVFYLKRIISLTLKRTGI